MRATDSSSRSSRLHANAFGRADRPSNLLARWRRGHKLPAQLAVLSVLALSPACQDDPADTQPTTDADAAVTTPGAQSEGQTGVPAGDPTQVTGQVDAAVPEGTAGDISPQPDDGGLTAPPNDPTDAGAPSMQPTSEPAGFQPCPDDGTPCKILPLGDSITFGIGSSGGGGGGGFFGGFGGGAGYRVELFRHALAEGKAVTFVGSVQNGPQTVDGEPFPRANEGHSGWTIEQIRGLVPTPALNETPNIILLMAGTNDMYRPGAGGAPERFELLLDALIEAAPDALIVAAQLTPLGNSSEAVQSFNASLPAIIEARASAGKHVMLVDMFTGFSPGLLADGVHPNDEGYALMADVWYDAIGPLLR